MSRLRRGRRPRGPAPSGAAVGGAAILFFLLFTGGGVPARGQTVLEGRRASVVHWPGDSLRAHGLLEAIGSLGSLPGLPPGVPETPIRVILAPSEAVLDSLLGGGAPEWGAGFADPSTRTIVLPAYPSDRTRFGDPARVLRHEWAHLALHAHVGAVRIPRWFDEGYAEWATGWDASEAWRLRVAFAVGDVPPLDSLTLRFPGDAASARLAYLLSATAVDYLVEASGTRGLRLLLDEIRETESFERAFRRTYGATVAQFEEDWRKHVKERYGWLLLLSHSAVFWLAASVLLLVLFWIRRRRDRRKMAKLRATEPPDRPAFWMPDFWRGSGGEEEGDGEPPAGPPAA